MFGFGKKQPEGEGPQVSWRYCTDVYKGQYPHVGLYDCRDARVWVCKPLSGQAIRTAHARLLTGADSATSTVWKDRFLCFWFYPPGTGEGRILGQTLNWNEGHLLVRIDPNWDYDRQRLLPGEQTTQVEENLHRQYAHGERVLAFYETTGIDHPLTLHLIAQRVEESLFGYRRIGPP